MFVDAGPCPHCTHRLRWESMPGSAGYWALYHGVFRLGMAAFDGLLVGGTRAGMERTWPAQWHARATREDGA